jgi:hypothetical protein
MAFEPSETVDLFISPPRARIASARLRAMIAKLPA